MLRQPGVLNAATAEQVDRPFGSYGENVRERGAICSPLSISYTMGTKPIRLWDRQYLVIHFGGGTREAATFLPYQAPLRWGIFGILFFQPYFIFTMK